MRRRPFAAAALLGLAALATACGIRPTAVPVDAGAPASRTACPTVARIPTAPSAPTPTAGVGAAAQAPAHAATVRAGAPTGAPTGPPGVQPAASPSPVVVSPTPPADNVFGALPSPTASTTAPCR
ncbi:hypothetical protein ACFVUH_05680 [Kitasatospora sp. NPDC058032]|uniref:hypothetical protein n=1 Tax=Kitasatospora sp. NPDC058032 TaxID=3346307 RepID=UPI0036DE5926